PGMTDLGAERDAELDALHIERVVQRIGRRAFPEPRDDPQRLEAEVLHRALELAHRGDGTLEIDGGHAEEAVRVAARVLTARVVAGAPLARPAPRSQHEPPDPRLVHLLDGLVGAEAALENRALRLLEERRALRHPLQQRPDPRLRPRVDQLKVHWR